VKQPSSKVSAKHPRDRNRHVGNKFAPSVLSMHLLQAKITMQYRMQFSKCSPDRRHVNSSLCKHSKRSAKCKPCYSKSFAAMDIVSQRRILPQVHKIVWLDVMNLVAAVVSTAMNRTLLPCVPQSARRRCTRNSSKIRPAWRTRAPHSCNYSKAAKLPHGLLASDGSWKVTLGFAGHGLGAR
jgi:hypothetical protein